MRRVAARFVTRGLLLVLAFLPGILLVTLSCQSPRQASPSPPTQTALRATLATPSPPPPTQQTPSTPSTQPTTPTPTPIPAPRELQVEVVARNLDVPWSLAFAPDGRLFFTERPGRILVLEPGKTPRLLATVEVTAQGEGGLLGLALSPTFAQDHYIYIYHTYRDAAGLKNRVVRFTEQGDRATSPTTIIDNIPGAVIHDGGRLGFGPDGKLYIAAGDASQSELAQNPGSLAGKILRLNPDGSIPADNPFPGSPVFSLGHRNPQGLDWHPSTGKLYEVEHGTTAHDELNLIAPGGNYGWPRVIGKGNNPQFLGPLLESGNDTWAPSGASFYRGSQLVGWQGSFFFAALRGEALHRVTFRGPEFREIETHQVLLKGVHGRLRDVVEGPDGFLYIATNNRDGRGSPTAEDDRILRIVTLGN